ncbi:serine protease [Scheffersomyces spartinae]|uniref:Serine protease n=1 Tax=Scheffersomyces spartinae TaxID=45513 RepID=A0A9P7VAN1_9ASCO|nr:serine protease [Scheffersomyces spartinae]KAG7194468.1 serine protease [Scheffersomyces spartinae]
MLLSKAVALSILTALGVQALVIPSAEQVVDIFKTEVGEIAEQANGIAGEVLAKLKIDLLPNSVPLHVQENRDVLPHKYIIVFKDGTSKEEMLFHQEWVALEHFNSLADDSAPHVQQFLSIVPEGISTQGGIEHVFDIENFMSGYSGYFLPSTIEMIRRHPNVKFVEQDSIVRANEFDIEKGAPWGLARVSHREPLSLNSFNQYLYDSEGGEGVTSYIIDTGINVKHTEFSGRATWGATIPTGDEDVDGNGHGTHCAGTIASDTYGVAKKANVVAIKVLRSNGSGSMSDVVKGVEFAAKSHQDAVKSGKKGFKGSTANMSLGGGKSPALDLAVNAAVKAGIHFAVAAGNENQDACNTSPAAAELAITVGASTISDSRAYFSNYGKCVDIFAPGLNILSTYIGSESATAVLSGTSMASPHIAGLLSYFVSLQPGAGSEFFTSDKGVTPAQLKKNLIHFGSKNMLSDIPDDGTPNILAFNGAGHNLTAFWGEDTTTSGSVVADETHLNEQFEQLEGKIEGLVGNFLSGIKKSLV